MGAPSTSRRPRPGRPWATSALVLTAVLWAASGVVAGPSLLYTTTSFVLPSEPLAPARGGTTHAGTGSCESTLSVVVESSGSSAVRATITEPSGCPGGTALEFPAALVVGDGLAAGTNGTLWLSLRIVGETNASLLRELTAGFASLTGGSSGSPDRAAEIAQGAVVVAESDPVAARPGSSYGAVFSVTLDRSTALTGATVDLLVVSSVRESGTEIATVAQPVTLVVRC